MVQCCSTLRLWKAFKFIILFKVSLTDINSAYFKAYFSSCCSCICTCPLFYIKAYAFSSSILKVSVGDCLGEDAYNVFSNIFNCSMQFSKLYAYLKNVIRYNYTFYIQVLMFNNLKNWYWFLLLNICHQFLFYNNVLESFLELQIDLCIYIRHYYVFSINW